MNTTNNLRLSHYPGIGILELSGVDGTENTTISNVGPLAPNRKLFPRLLTAIAELITTVSTMGDLTVQEIDKRDKTAATLSTNLTGATDNDLTFTAATKGAVGNDITVAYVNPGTESAELGVVVTDTDIVVNLATDAGTKAYVETNLAGATNNDMRFTARNAIGTAGHNITIAYVDPSGNDAALDVAVVGNAITVNLATDGEGTITSTAAQVKTAIEASAAANALVVVTNKASNDGTGLVAALSSTPLANGVNPAITTIASEVDAAIAADAEANALVSVANKSANDGTGLVAALSETPLTGGLEWVVVKTIVNNVTFTAAATGDRQDYAVTSVEELDGNNYLLFQFTGSLCAVDNKKFLLEAIVS